MKVYILKDEDFEALTAAIDRDPAYGNNGGSSQAISPQEKAIYNAVHSWYNHQIRNWINKQTK